MWSGWIPFSPSMRDRCQARLIAPMISSMAGQFDQLGILADFIEDACPELARRLRKLPTACDLMNVLMIGDYRATGMLSAAKGKAKRYASICATARRAGFGEPEATFEELAIGLVSDREMRGFVTGADGLPLLPPVAEVENSCRTFRHVLNLVYAGLAEFSTPPDIHPGIASLRDDILLGFKRMEQS